MSLLVHCFFCFCYDKIEKRSTIVVGERMFEHYAKAKIAIDDYSVVVMDKKKIPFLRQDTNYMLVWDTVIQTALDVDFLEAGFVFIPRYIEQFQWIPVLLYSFDSGYEFVGYNESWKCKSCGYQTGSVLLHQVYHDSFYTTEDLNKIRAKIDRLFPMARCPQCNAVLSGHPLLLQNK